MWARSMLSMLERRMTMATLSINATFSESEYGNVKIT